MEGEFTLNVQDMLVNAVNYYRQYEQKNQLQYLPETRFKNAFVNLDLALANLANDMGWTVASVDRPTVSNEELLNQYVKVIRAFLLMANLRNWNKVTLINDDELTKLSRKIGQTDLSKSYLAIKNMLYAAYFKHSQTDFDHAWKLILKLGLADLGFTTQAIAKAFDQQVGIESK
ncbi:2-deoxyuridine 5-triphosphate nucleotidohydrolase [Lactobacillaceae bacterium Scapto_B20]